LKTPIHDKKLSKQNLQNQFFFKKRNDHAMLGLPSQAKRLA
jgi:hypothetical protein